MPKRKKAGAEEEKEPLVRVRMRDGVAGPGFGYSRGEAPLVPESRAENWVEAGIAEFVPDPATIADPQDLADRITELETENEELRQKVEDMHGQILELTAEDESTDGDGAVVGADADAAAGGGQDTLV